MPSRQGIRVSEHFRACRDRVDADGKLTLRHNSRLHHIGIGRRWAGTNVLILARDRELRIITQDNGELIRQLTLDPSPDYQPQAPKV
jgi:hypothetical protein